MLMLLAIAVPLAVLGMNMGGDDEDTVSEVGTEDADRLEGGNGDDSLDG